jgi:hypothetical protein
MQLEEQIRQAYNYMSDLVTGRDEIRRLLYRCYPTSIVLVDKVMKEEHDKKKA